MSAQTGMNELAERKRLLLMEAELHRSIIGLERQRLEERMASLTMLRGHFIGGGSWLVAGAALAGLLAVRRWGNLMRWLPRVMWVWRFWRKGPSTKVRAAKPSNHQPADPGTTTVSGRRMAPLSASDAPGSE
jgi:hypothetical protein